MTINFALVTIENLKNLHQDQLEDFFSQLLSKLGVDNYVALLSKDKSESLQTLNDLGFGIDKKTAQGASLLYYAASAGLIAAVFVLHKLGYANKKTKSDAGLGHYAALNGHATAVKAFVKEGLVKLDDKDKNGAGFLLYAARNGHAGAIRCLIDEMHLDPRETNKAGAGIIHYSVMGGILDGMKALIEQGFDQHAVDKNGETPLHYAVSLGKIHMICPLIEEYGLCPDTLNDAHESILHLAMAREEVDLTRPEVTEAELAQEQNRQKVIEICSDTEYLNRLIENYLSRNFQSENPAECLREQKSFSM